jgi:aminoglycoside phosphotransferase family enzyme
MYRGVVKIADLNNDNNKIRIRQLQKRGRALEYAVKMVEIPQKYRMDNLIATNKVSLKTMERLTEVISDFHRSRQTNTRIMNFGQPKSIRRKINENFETLGKLTSINPKFKEQLISFVINNNKLFYSRIREHKIREIHGDLYLKNIFIVQKKKFYLYDRIEFNDSLRFADVAEDIAHLSMDLDYHKRNDLRKYFISQYINKSEDVNLENLIYFLMCYKACVRAKVSYFRAKNEPIIKNRVPYLEESKNLLRLAESYLGLF